jgi:hypothetical protein
VLSPTRSSAGSTPPRPTERTWPTAFARPSGSRRLVRRRRRATGRKWIAPSGCWPRIHATTACWPPSDWASRPVESATGRVARCSQLPRAQPDERRFRAWPGNHNARPRTLPDHGAAPDTADRLGLEPLRSKRGDGVASVQTDDARDDRRELTVDLLRARATLHPPAVQRSTQRHRHLGKQHLRRAAFAFAGHAPGLAHSHHDTRARPGARPRARPESRPRCRSRAGSRGPGAWRPRGSTGSPRRR